MRDAALEELRGDKPGPVGNPLFMLALTALSMMPRWVHPKDPRMPNKAPPGPHRDAWHSLKPAPAGKRYVYEPQAGDPQMRTVFSCIGGKVADVERTVVR
jgi:hypothetical protein